MADLEPDTSPEATLDACCLDDCTTTETVAALRTVVLRDDDGNPCDTCEGVDDGGDLG